MPFTSTGKTPAKRSITFGPWIAIMPVDSVWSDMSKSRSSRCRTAVIALQGQPCGQVVTATKQGDNDYAVACKDGSRYRVFVNAEGRVVVQKQ